MSIQQNETEPSIVNSGYGSSDETASLLLVGGGNEGNPTIVSMGSKQVSTMSSHSSTNGPTGGGNKPVLIRQDRTSTYLASPQLSAQGGSEESGGTMGADTRSVPDIELHCDAETPKISVCDAESKASNYQLVPYNRCRACRNCDRRASTAVASLSTGSSALVGRSASKESVAVHGGGRYSPGGLSKQQSASIPPVLITSSPTGSRIIRQSSQPEQSNIVCCGAHCAHAHTTPNVSLQRLKDPADGIAGIAADSLRINGAMKPFKQVSFLLLSFYNSPHFYTLTHARAGFKFAVGAV